MTAAWASISARRMVGIGLFLDRRDQGFQRVRVLGLEHRPRRFEAPGRIRRHQGQAAHRGVDGAADAVVDADRREVAGDRSGRLSGRGVEDRAGAVPDEDSLLLRAEQQPAVLQGFDQRDRQRTAALGNRGDRRVGVGEVVGEEPGQCAVEILRLRGARHADERDPQHDAQATESDGATGSASKIPRHRAGGIAPPAFAHWQSD